MSSFLLICNTDGALAIFRRPIIKKLISKKFKVTTISSRSTYFEELIKLKAIPYEIDFYRHSVSVFKNIKLLFDLYKKIDLISPDVVHSFTHKPAIYGSLIARLLGVGRIFVTVTGLGTLFINNDIRSILLREILIFQYRIAMLVVDTVFFQNPDDRDYFLNRGIVTPHQAVLTNGSGIDFKEVDEKIKDSDRQLIRKAITEETNIDVKRRQIVLFPARAVREKGVYEFYEAARLLNKSDPSKYLFLHLGFIDSSAKNSSFKEIQINSYAEECGVHFLGFKHDILHYMLASDIITLPSYREGAPRSLIEAIALGRTVVTTDTPGCREVVLDGCSGFLCRVGDIASLAEKLSLATPDFCSRASAIARQLCEKKYDADQVVEVTMERYKL